MKQVHVIRDVAVVLHELRQRYSSSGTPERTYNGNFIQAAEGNTKIEW
jgi:hypothetical protein